LYELLSKFKKKASGKNSYNFLTKIDRDLRLSPFDRGGWGTCAYEESKFSPRVLGTSFRRRIFGKPPRFPEKKTF